MKGLGLKVLELKFLVLKDQHMRVVELKAVQLKDFLRMKSRHESCDLTMLE